MATNILTPNAHQYLLQRGYVNPAMGSTVTVTDHAYTTQIN